MEIDKTGSKRTTSSEAKPMTDPKRMTYTQVRRFVRLPTSFPVQIVSSTLRTIDEATDLSEGGVGLTTLNPLVPSTVIPIRLMFPHAKDPIEVMGRVMWSTDRAMGVRFEQANVALVETVERLRAALERL